MKTSLKINITGPESSGKTTLAVILSTHFQLPMVQEYAREYLMEGQKVDSAYDLLRLAHEQIKLENAGIAKSGKGIVCDTDLLVLRIWCLEKFHRVPAALHALWRHHQYNLTFLCQPNLTWQPDPFRENPRDRDRLFKIYFSLLSEGSMQFTVVDGVGEERYTKVIKIVEEYLKHH